MKRFSRFWATVVIVSLSTVAMVVFFSFWLTATESGSRFLLEQALATYNRDIAGDVKIGSVRGALAGQLVLGDVDIGNRDGERLVHVDTVAVQMEPTRLFLGEIPLARVHISGVRISLPEEGHPGFEDLAFSNLPDSEKQLEPDEHFLPSLPLDEGAFLLVSHVQVCANTDQNICEPMMVLTDFRASIWGQGHRATLGLVTRNIGLPGIELEVDELITRLSWSDPVLAVEHFAVVTDRGDMHIDKGTLDLFAKTLELGLAGELDGFDFGSSTISLVPSGVEFVVDGVGTMDRFVGNVSAVGNTGVQLETGFQIGFDPLIEAHAVINAGYFIPPDISGFGDSTIELAAEASVSVDKDGRVESQAAVRCADCTLAELGDLKFEALAGLKGEDACGETAMSFAGARARLSAGFVGGGDLDGRWYLSVPELTTIASLMDPELSKELLSGRVEGSGICLGTGPSTTCTGGLLVDDFSLPGVRVAKTRLSAKILPMDENSPFNFELNADKAKVAGRVWNSITASARGNPATIHTEVSAQGQGRDRVNFSGFMNTDDGLYAGVDRLDAVVKGLDIKLLEPTHIRYRQGVLKIPLSSLLLAEGRVQASAEINPATVSKGYLLVEDLDISRLKSVLPALKVNGTVRRIEAVLKGRSRHPEIAVHGAVDSLTIGETSMGNTRFDLAYDDLRLVASVDAVGKDGLSLRGKANLPIKLDLADGRSRIQANKAASASLELKGLQLSGLVEAFTEWDLEAEIEGRSTLTGTLRSPTLDLDLRAKGIRFEEQLLGEVAVVGGFEDRRLSAVVNGSSGFAEKMQIDLSGHAQVDVEKWQLDWDVSRGLKLNADIEGVDFSSLQTFALNAGLGSSIGLAGRGTAHMNGQWGKKHTEFAAELAAREMVVGHTSVGNWRGQVEYDGKRLDVTVDGQGGLAKSVEGSFDIPLDFDHQTGKVSVPETGHKVQIGVAGLNTDSVQELLEHMGVTASSGGVPISALLDIDFVSHGSWKKPTMSVELVGQDFGVEGLHLGTLHANASLESGRGDAHTWIEESTRTLADLEFSAPLEIGFSSEGPKIKWDHSGSHSGRVAVTGLDAQLLSHWIELPDKIDGKLSIRGSARGSLHDFTGSANAGGRIQYPGFPAVTMKIEAEANERAQRVTMNSWTAGGEILQTTIEADAGIGDLMSGKSKAADIPVRVVSIVEDLPLSMINPFLPTAFYDARGNVSGRFDANGPLGDLDLSGEVSILKGEVTVAEFNQRLKKIEASVAFDDRRIEIERLSFVSGNGNVYGDGEFNFDENQGRRGSLELTFKQFPFVRPGVPQGVIDTQIRTDYVEDKRERKVTVTIRDTDVDLTGEVLAAPKMIPSSTVIRFVEENEKSAILPPVAAQEVREELPLVVTLIVESPAVIRGPGVDMSWKGKVSADLGDREQTFAGKITAQRGWFRLMGNAFEIDTGEITLPPGTKIDSYVNIAASTQTAEARVTARVRGRLSQPDIEFSSDPPMPQYRILTLLVTGRAGTGEQEQSDGNVQAQAASLLLAFNNPTIERVVNQRLGIDRIQVGIGDQVDEPIVAVGKWLGRKLYVETRYHHNAPPEKNQKGVHVEYRFTPRWSLETFYGDANEGGVDIFWRKQFSEDTESGD